MKFFIGIVPPENIYHTVLNIQQQFGDNRLEPHITLRPPVTVAHKEQWEQAIEEVASSFTPINIELPGTGYFGNRVLFIDVVAEQLGKLYGVVTKAIKPFEQPDLREQGNQIYHPHLTLGRKWCGFTSQDFVKMKLLADEFLIGKQMGFTANFIRIYHKPLPHGQYEPMKDIPLNAT
ncbi:MAG: 2-5 ligase [Segetibacter sp.]|nr:2-5 ligase [Segetibacter sp.]